MDEDRKAVCTKHGMAYPIKLGCIYCEDDNVKNETKPKVEKSIKVNQNNDSFALELYGYGLTKKDAEELRKQLDEFKQHNNKK